LVFLKVATIEADSVKIAWCSEVPEINPQEGRKRPSPAAATLDACSNDIRVLTGSPGRNVAVPLSQLTAIEADESTTRSHRRLTLLCGARPTAEP